MENLLIFFIIGIRLNILNKINAINIIARIVNGMYKGGNSTLSNKKLEFIIIPIPRLKKIAGIKINKDSINSIFLRDLFFEPIALIIRKSLAFSNILPFW